MSSVRLIPLIFRGFVFLPQRITTIAPSIQPFRSFAPYAPRSRKNSKSKKSQEQQQRHSKYDDNQIIPDALDELPQAENIYRRPEYHFSPKHDISEYPNVMLSNEEKEISIAFLKKVVSTVEERGHQFLLPWADETAIETILDVLKELIKTTGIHVEFLFDAFTLKPQLFAALTNNGNKSIEILDCLCDLCGFSIQDAIRIFGSYTQELLSTDSNEITQRLSVFIGSGVKAGRSMARVVRGCPAILFASNQQQMAENAEAMGSFFSRPQMAKILMNDPEIVLKNFELIEFLYEYIYYHMGIEGDEFIESKKWSRHSLEDVMNRHQFLLKTGKYEFPDPKKPQLKLENPPLYRILDTNDGIFATQVAKVSTDEWILYKELATKLETLEDKDRPFERIKPSQRKAFERKLKERKEHQAFVFDGQENAL